MAKIAPEVQNITPLKLKNDGALQLAEGRSRWETNWRNRDITWGKMLAKLKQTKRTAETLEEYRALPKPEQDKIKDVGGFVGGTLKGGSRKTQNVLARQIVTLDADFAGPDFWEDVELTATFAVAAYSTHKHTPEAPRLRLLIPLSRPVSPEEYQAIARRIAADFTIDAFDDTTYEPARLMYWPSSSKDGDYFFDYIDAPWLDADEVLATYSDWSDPSFWPESSRSKTERKRLADKQGDPTEKPGAVGLFCRTYTIEEAIDTFLSDVYEEAGPGRYTFIGGTTSGGLVLYEDHFAFSHHGTDPVSGKLCNAFDLVRLHKFADLDDGTPKETAPGKTPSFIAMSELVMEDEQVKATYGAERMAQAQATFGPIPDDEEDSTDEEDEEYTLADEWLKKLETVGKNGKGGYASTIDNVIIILNNDPRLKDRLLFDEFHGKALGVGPLPWRPAKGIKDWEDPDDAGLQHYLESVYQISSKAKIDPAVMVVMEAHKVHPVRDYLNGLKWDGVPRIDTLLIEYLGAEDSVYVREATRKLLVAAAGRIIRPGIKFDYMMILTGPQGIGKSTLLRKLGKDWYSDSIYTVTGKEAYEQIGGVWVAEMAELTATRKADVEAIKHFISKQEDTFRKAYARRPQTIKRQCVFVGTSNDRECLRDRTGNRRFWPVDVYIVVPPKSVIGDLTPEIVDQLWAEALTLFLAGEELYLSGKASIIAEEKQELHTEDNAKAGLIREFLDTPLPPEWPDMDIADRRLFLHGEFEKEPIEDGSRRDKVCVAEVWVELFGKDLGQLKPIESREISDILRSLRGWEPYAKAGGRMKFGRHYGQQRAFVRKKEEDIEI